MTMPYDHRQESLTFSSSLSGDSAQPLHGRGRDGASSSSGPGRLGRGAVLFTGPDGIRDHRVAVEDEHRCVGEGTMSPEGTSEVEYLWRAPKGIPFPRPKSSCVGGIGWGIPRYIDWKPLQTGRQIQLGEFRQTVEDRHTHLYQDAWYPSPEENFSQNSNAAFVMNVYPRRTRYRDNRTRPLPAMGPSPTHDRITPEQDHGRLTRTSTSSSLTSQHRPHSAYSEYSGRGYSQPRDPVPRF